MPSATQQNRVAQTAVRDGSQEEQRVREHVHTHTHRTETHTARPRSEHSPLNDSNVWLVAVLILIAVGAGYLFGGRNGNASPANTSPGVVSTTPVSTTDPVDDDGMTFRNAAGNGHATVSFRNAQNNHVNVYHVYGGNSAPMPIPPVVPPPAPAPPL